ncbi:MAG: beta-ketoacyl synthase N-terminal-like domain-containing protein, partial [Gemmatimonadota bacterium]
MRTDEVVIVGAARSAVGRGKKDGALAGVHPVELSAAVMRATVARAGVDPAQIDDVIWGCAMPEAGQGLNIARLASLRAGFPVEVSGMTVNRFCSSGLQTIALGAQAILSGMNDVVLAGGIEMMSAVPMSGFTTRLHPDLVEENIGMGFTAERVAKRWGITREAQDAFALASQQKAAAAQAAGRFQQEIVPIPVEHVRWRGAEQSVTTSMFETDELVRGGTTLEGLAKLPPA